MIPVLALDFIKNLWGYWWNNLGGNIAFYEYLVVIALFIVFSFWLGWTNKEDCSAEGATAYIRLAFWPATILTHAGVIGIDILTALIAKIPFADMGITAENLLIFGLGYVLFFILPYFVIKFILVKIPGINLASPFILMAICLPYAAGLAIHGNLGRGAKSRNGGGVHYSS